MTREVTAAVNRALETAAARAGAVEVGAVHIVFALLDDDGGKAATLAAEAGLDRIRWLDQSRPALQTGNAVEPPRNGLELEAILAEAWRLAADLSGERTAASEHLLLAALRRSPVLAAELTGFGLNPEQLEQSVRGSVGCPPLRLDEPLTFPEPAEQVAANRILDASANRAREALRILEDYCRFSLDDALLTRQTKELRHGLTEALGVVPPDHLLEGRDTLGDVGTTLTTRQEGHRGSLRDVVAANVKRLQEALRSLEEYGKLRGPDLGRALEALRYRSYTLERALLLGTTARERLVTARLMVLLTGAHCTASLDWTVAEAAAGGATVFQLREKSLTDAEFLERARRVRRRTRDAGALFIVNDRPDVARLAEADGVHLGQDDLPVKEARRVVGPGMLIGVSTHNLEQLRRAVLDGASYIGVGPTFPSGTKSFDHFAGLEFVRQAAAETSLPAFAIGGVNADTIAAAASAGAKRVAVSQAICRAADPRAAAAALLRQLPESV
jgi:thiamine-phosphate pyrophosphorylase